LQSPKLNITNKQHTKNRGGRYDSSRGGRSSSRGGGYMGRGRSSIGGGSSDTRSGDRPGGPPPPRSSYADMDRGSSSSNIPSYASIADSMPSYASIADGSSSSARAGGSAADRRSIDRGGSFDDELPPMKRSRGPIMTGPSRRSSGPIMTGPSRRSSGPIMTGPSRHETSSNSHLPLPPPPSSAPPRESNRWESDRRDYGGSVSSSSDRMSVSTSRGVGGSDRSLSVHASKEDPYQYSSRPSPRDHQYQQTTDEDQFGRRSSLQQRGPPPSSQRSSYSGGYAPRSTSSTGLDRRTSVNSSGLDRGIYSEDSRQYEYQPSPSRRESGYSQSRYEGPPSESRSMNNRSPLPLPPPPATAPYATSQTKQQHYMHDQQHHSQYSQNSNHTGDQYEDRHRQQNYHDEQRSQMPQQQPSPPPTKTVPVISAPPSPVCPPSPPPAAPSGHALALTRMIEMNADMEFAYARLMMLEQEEKKVQARLEAFKELS